MANYALQFRPPPKKIKQTFTKKPEQIVQKSEEVIRKTEKDVRQGEIILQKNESNNLFPSLQKIRDELKTGYYIRKDDKKPDENSSLNNLK